MIPFAWLYFAVMVRCLLQLPVEWALFYVFVILSAQASFRHAAGSDLPIASGLSRMFNEILLLSIRSDCLILPTSSCYVAVFIDGGGGGGGMFSVHMCLG